MRSLPTTVFTTSLPHALFTHAARVKRTLFLCTIAATMVSSSAQAGDCEPTWSNQLGTPGMSSGYVASLAVYEGQLYATGNFASAGGQPGTARIARWNGTTWVGVGGGLQNQYSNVLGVFDGDLYVGGYFDSAGGVPGTAKLARWTGSAWESIGAQLESFLSSIWAFKVFDDGTGPALYIGGNFLDIGGTTIDHIARWDGNTFTEVGGTIVGPNQIVLDLAVYKGELIACGRFATIAGVPAANIARWDGKEWKPLGGGLPGTQVICLEVSGDSLYAGGSFTVGQGSPGMRIARWDGESWHPLGPGLDATVQDITVFNDGNGERVYAAGNFGGTADGSVSMSRIGAWDGVAWSPVGSGADDTVFETFAWTTEDSNQLLFGGNFTQISGLLSNRVASYVGCPLAVDCTGDFTGDGSVDGADLGLLLAAWGPCKGCVEDLNDDGVVDGADLGELLGAWGPCIE